MAKQKQTPYKPFDLKPSANLYPDSQPCVRKTFSASFVSQPAENHTSKHTIQLKLNLELRPLPTALYVKEVPGLTLSNIPAG